MGGVGGGMLSYLGVCSPVPIRTAIVMVDWREVASVLAEVLLDEVLKERKHTLHLRQRLTETLQHQQVAVAVESHSRRAFGGTVEEAVGVGVVGVEGFEEWASTYERLAHARHQRRLRRAHERRACQGSAHGWERAGK